MKVKIKLADKYASSPLAKAWCEAYEAKLVKLLTPQFAPVAVELECMHESGVKSGDYWTMLARYKGMTE